MDVRILRTYRHMSPGNFHVVVQRVGKGLVKVWDVIVTANPKLKQAFEEALPQHDETFHEALLGSIIAKARRDLLQAQLTELMDEIAVILEGAAYYNPELLLLSGFDLAKERRGHTRAKAASTAMMEFQVAKHQQDGSDQGTPSAQ